MILDHKAAKTIANDPVLDNAIESSYQELTGAESLSQKFARSVIPNFPESKRDSKMPERTLNPQELELHKFKAEKLPAAAFSKPKSNSRGKRAGLERFYLGKSRGKS